jgi:hypothetical protein
VQLDTAILSDRCNTCRQATCETNQDEFYRRRTFVFRGKNLRMIRVVVELPYMLLFFAKPEKALDAGLCVRTTLPLA